MTPHERGMLAIESLGPGARERCLELARAVGWPREEKKWDLFLAHGRAFGTSGDHGALTSMVVVTPFEVGSFVAMMVVHPSAQGRGIGRALMEHALADAAQPVMLYATESGRLLYERMGFVVVDSVLKLGGTPRPTVMSARLRLVTAADLGHVVAADRHAFGSGRERHIAGVLDGASRAVMDDDGGFAIAWHNGALTIVGPVVARDEDAAIALIDGALEGNEGVARIDVAVTSPRVIAHARAIGFEDRGASPLMTWPQAARLGERSRYHAILLQGLG